MLSKTAGWAAAWHMYEQSEQRGVGTTGPLPMITMRWRSNERLVFEDQPQGMRSNSTAFHSMVQSFPGSAAKYRKCLSLGGSMRDENKCGVPKVYRWLAPKHLSNDSWKSRIQLLDLPVTRRPKPEVVHLASTWPDFAFLQLQNSITRYMYRPGICPACRNLGVYGVILEATKAVIEVMKESKVTKNYHGLVCFWGFSLMRL
jgi:hypothetical protein